MSSRHSLALREKNALCETVNPAIPVLLDGAARHSPEQHKYEMWEVMLKGKNGSFLHASRHFYASYVNTISITDQVEMTWKSPDK